MAIVTKDNDILFRKRRSGGIFSKWWKSALGVFQWSRYVGDYRTVIQGAAFPPVPAHGPRSQSIYLCTNRLIYNRTPIHREVANFRSRRQNSAVREQPFIVLAENARSDQRIYTGIRSFEQVLDADLLRALKTSFVREVLRRLKDAVLPRFGLTLTEQHGDQVEKVNVLRTHDGNVNVPKYFRDGSDFRASSSICGLREWIDSGPWVGDVWHYNDCRFIKPATRRRTLWQPESYGPNPRPGFRA